MLKIKSLAIFFKRLTYACVGGYYTNYSKLEIKINRLQPHFNHGIGE